MYLIIPGMMVGDTQSFIYRKILKGPGSISHINWIQAESGIKYDFSWFYLGLQTDYNLTEWYQ